MRTVYLQFFYIGTAKKRERDLSRGTNMDKLSSKSEIQKYGCLGSTKYGSVDYSEMYNIQCCFFLKEQSHVTY